MTSIYLTFTIMIALLAVLKWPKLKAILFVGIVIAAPFMYWDTLSRPKNLTDELRSDEQVKILGYHVNEGVAVYYLLLLPDLDEPRYYYEPWTEESKKRVEDMQKGAEAGQGMLLMNPFEHSWEKEKPKTVHPLPQPKLLEKKAPPPIKEFAA